MTWSGTRPLSVRHGLIQIHIKSTLSFSRCVVYASRAHAGAHTRPQTCWRKLHRIDQFEIFQVGPSGSATCVLFDYNRSAVLSSIATDLVRKGVDKRTLQYAKQTAIYRIAIEHFGTESTTWTCRGADRGIRGSEKKAAHRFRRLCSLDLIARKSSRVLLDRATVGNNYVFCKRSVNYSERSRIPIRPKDDVHH